MYRTVSLLAIIALVTVASTAFAVETMQNDSDSIILPGAATPGGTVERPDDSTEGSGGSSNDEERIDNGSGEDLIYHPPQPDSSGGVTVGVGAPNNPPANGDTGGATNTNPVIQTLTNSNSFTITQNSSGAGSGTTEERITFSADSAREAFGSIGVTRLVVRGWDPVTNTFITLTDGKVPPAGAPLVRTNEELGILAASAALDDGHLGAVTMDGTDITIQYKSSGRLLYVVPITFPIGISVHAAASTTAERIELTYPWYKWFVWLTVPEDELIIAIDTAIATAQSQITATTSLKDTQGRLFIGISNALKHAHEEYEQGIRIVL